MRANTGVARLRAHLEGLEHRCLMSSMQETALMGPVPAALRLLRTAGQPHAAGLYAATNALTRSISDAAVAVVAQALAPFDLNRGAIRQALGNAPLESAPGAEADALVLPLPMPDGSFSSFRVVEAPIMEAGLAAQFPDIKTYRGIGIDDPSASLRLDLTPLGFHAQVLSTQGSYYIDPFFRNDAAGTHASYYKRDMVAQARLDCVVLDPRSGAAAEEEDDPSSPLEGIFADALDEDTLPLPITYGTQLRTYRAAVAANSTYTAFHGGTVSAGQAAVVTTMNRVVGVYETELAIRMVLVANNSSVIYASPASDPYTNSSAALNQNTPNLNSVIGVNNYDIGHVLTTGSGGIAYLASVGNPAIKGGGTTGLPSPDGDAFDIDYVAHEMGHQFGADHTFNTSVDANRNGPTAYEPGSGSTIMSYAGITGAEDLQPHSDPYFHSASIDEIRTFVTTAIPGIGTTSSTGNAAPIVSAGPDRVIPIDTPFALTATGSDPDGHPLTFEWQQRDLGPARLLSATDPGNGPLFRDYVPTTSPTRMLPRLASILAGMPVTAAPAGGSRVVERLYTTARTSNWRVIARDNRAGGGGVATDDVALTVVNTGGVFSVTSPNSAGSWGEGSSQTVTWNVAGTTGNGINTANVKISLSTDGGMTFPNVLAASTPNDGSESIIVPSIGTSAARIKVEAVGNIFFDISNFDFTISAPVPSTIAGQAFEDRNANGLFDGGEPTLNGVRVFLDTNDNGAQDGGESFVDTAGSGNYSFASLPPATYHLRQVVPPTHMATSATVFDISAGGGTITRNFANFRITHTGTASADTYMLRIGEAAASPFSDDFNRAALNSGAYAYATTVTSGDGGASIVGNLLTLTNDASAATNAAGAVYVATPTSAFGGFVPTLNQNTTVVTWRFNMQQIRTDPSGFGSGNYGVAFILGGSNGVFTGGGAGNGYAVTVGNNGGNDRIKLVRFTGGISSATTITEGNTDATSKYWSLKVTYDPGNNQWRLFTRDDGTNAFDDPNDDTDLDPVGSTVADATYAATPLNFAGGLWNYSTQTGQTAKFDNFSVTAGAGGGTPNQLQVLVGGVVTHTIQNGLTPWLKFNLGEGDDSLSVDYANGNPMPAGGVFFDGGSGANDILNLIGSAAADSITLASAFTGPTAGNIDLHNASTGAQSVESIAFNGAAGSDTLTLNAGSYAFNSDAGAGGESVSVIANPGATLALNASQHLTSLSISDATVAMSANGSRVINTNALSIVGTGKLDLSDNDMIIRSGAVGAWNGSNYSGIHGLVKQGFSGGTWLGNGLVTSQTAALATRGRTTLGVALVSDALGIGPAATASWGGETVTGNAVLVKYTYAGDSNVDGVVDGDDFFNIDTAFPAASGYLHGDFDYNGLLDADDYFWIDQTYAFDGPPL